MARRGGVSFTGGIDIVLQRDVQVLQLRPDREGKVMFLYFAKSFVTEKSGAPAAAIRGGCAGVAVAFASGALSVISKQPSPTAAAAEAASIPLIIRFVIRFARRLIDRLALPPLNEAMLTTSHGSCRWKSDCLEMPRGFRRSGLIAFIVFC